LSPATQKSRLGINQFIDAWSKLCEAAPSPTMETAPDLEYRFSGVLIPFFNVAVVTASDASSDQLIAAARKAKAWAAGKGVPWMLVVTHESLQPGSDPVAALDAEGYAPVMPLTGMLAGDVKPGQFPPEELELKLATEPRECECVLNINAEAYGVSFDVGQPVWGNPAFWEHHIGIVGLVAGQPVSCAAVLQAGGHRYVAMVATVPNRQRRGYAEAAMRRALELAQQRWGALPTFLHATEAGRPVYERMGYETVSTHVVLMDKALLEGSGH
jgi:GNAT superfamily N-acetyltransferase